MGNKFDFIVVCSHGCGRNSIGRYLNSAENVSTLTASESKFTEHTLETFLEGPSSIKGIVLDSSHYTDKYFLNALLTRTNKNYYLLELSRDPLAKLFSHINHHIYAWTNAFAGLLIYNHSKFLLHKRNIEDLTEFLIVSDTMDTNPKLCPILHNSNWQHFDVSDLTFDVAEKNISDFLANMGIIKPNLKISLFPLNSRVNHFLTTIKQIEINLYQNIQVTLRPLPEDFVCYYGYGNDHCVATLRHSDAFQNFGQFKGDLCFFLENCDNYQAIRQELRERFKQDQSLLHEYCADISRRAELSNNLYELLHMNKDKLSTILHYNKQLKDKMKIWIEMYLEYYCKYDKPYLHKCIQTILFYKDLYGI